MGKKGHRQSDPGADKGEASDSSEDNKSVCQHVKKFKNKSSKTNKLSIYPVCKNCNDQNNKTAVEENAHVESGENASDSVDVDLLVCLFCASVGCGANGKGHAQAHQKLSHSDCHDFAFDIKKGTIWCFPCEKEVKAASLDTAMKALQKRIEVTSESKAPETDVKSGSKFYVNPNHPTPFLNKDLCSTKQKQPLVKGLMNLGNTCFFNSVLQCLAQTPYLIPVLERLFLKGENCLIPGKGKLEELGGELNAIDQCNDKNLPLVVPLLEQLKKMRNPEGSNIERPDSLLNCLKKRYPQFQGREQHDAHELLRHLLEGVRTDDHMRYREVILKKFDCYGKSKTKTTTNDTIKVIRDYGFQANELPLGPDILFRGELISILECSECKSLTHRPENFLDLSLPVTEEKPLPPTRKKDLDYNCGPSKHQLKKDRKSKKRAKKQAARQARETRQDEKTLPAEAENADAADSNDESDHSDADVEDNAETDTNLLESRNIESGYSSEKAQNGDSAESLSPAESGCAEGDLSPSLEAEPDESLPPTTDLLLGCPNKEVEPPLPFSLDEVESENSIPPSKTDLDLSGCSTIPLINEIPASPTPSPTSSSPSLAKGSDGDEDVFDFQISSNLTSQDCERVSDSTVNDCGGSPASDMPKCSPTEGGDGDVGAASALDVNDLQKRLSSLTCGNVSETGSTHSDKGESSKDTAKESNSICATYAKRLAPKISVPEGDCSVISCLNQFTAQELMTGSNKVGCENCTKNKGKDGRTVYTNATKQLLISAPPAILVIQLKRFIADLSRLKKMNRHVSFPKSLDLASFCSKKCLELPSIKPDQKEILYSLYGVVEHSGQMGGGHYVAYVKVRQALGEQDPRWKFLAPGRPFLEERPVPETVPETPTSSPIEEKWFYVSDSHVSAVDEEKVMRSQAYLLFYERVV